MSKYMKVTSTIKNPASLLAALADMGLEYTASSNMKENGVSLKTHWQSWGGVDTPVAIAVDVSALKKVDGSAFDGFGFAWNGAGYEMVVDHYDLERPFVNQIKQRYSINEAKRLAKMNGYSVMEQVASDGSVRLVCSSYSGGY